MSKIVFLNEPEVVYDGAFSQIGKNQVRLVFTSTIPSNETLTSGFNLVNEHNGRPQTKRTDYIYIYRTYAENPNMVELCNDNIPYVEPEITVTFNAEFGGTLKGETSQIVKNYEELVIPTPVADENYKFVAWNPEIPTSGKVEKDITFAAQFEYVETLEEILSKKITELEMARDAAIVEGLTINGLHYPYTATDKAELDTIFNTVKITMLPIGFQAENEKCREYSAEEIINIYVMLTMNQYSHRTYCNQACEYLESLEDTEENRAIISTYIYGTELNEEYLAHYNEMMALYQAQVDALIGMS